MFNQSSLFSLNSKDFAKGLITAIFSAVIIAIYQIVTTVGFDLFSVDWNLILHTVINTGVAAFLAYLSKNFLSDNEGKVLGRVG